MRKMIFAACILLGFATASNAQIEKGSILGGINGNFSFTSYHERTTTALRLNAYSLYALQNNFAAGLGIDNTFSFRGTKDDSDFYAMYSLLVAPEIRKYFGSNRLIPYIGLASGLSYDYFDADLPGVAAFKNYDFYLAPVAGLSYWLNDKVFLDFKASYDLVNPSQPGNPLNINFGIGIRLGK
jgi:hypothetical protein